MPGYTPLVLTSLFFGALTSLGFGIVGQYLWLGLQVSRRRPNYIVHSAEDHGTKNEWPGLYPRPLPIACRFDTPSSPG